RRSSGLALRLREEVGRLLAVAAVQSDRAQADQAPEAPAAGFFLVDRFERGQDLTENAAGLRVVLIREGQLGLPQSDVDLRPGGDSPLGEDRVEERVDRARRQRMQVDPGGGEGAPASAHEEEADSGALALEDRNLLLEPGDGSKVQAAVGAGSERRRD